MLLRYKQRKEWKVDDFGESMSGKLSLWIQELSAFGVVPGDGAEVWGIYI
jgi:hypothetical protein